MRKTLSEIQNEATRNAVEERLRDFGGNRTRAAASLGISRQQVVNLIRKHHIDIPPSYEPPKRQSPERLDKFVWE